MIYAITSLDYDFFSKEKDSIKKKKGIIDEYNVLDIEQCGSVYDEFRVDGFFEKPSYLLVYKYLFDEMNKSGFVYQLEDLANTKHTVIIYEKNSSKEFEIFIKKNSIPHFEPRKVVEKKIPTPFTFTDMVIARNKKDAWIEYMTLLKQKVEISQILAGLIWATKSMVLVLQYSTITQTGINPYVYTKLQKNKNMWTLDQARLLLKNLLYISAVEQFDTEAQSIQIEKLLFEL